MTWELLLLVFQVFFFSFSSHVTFILLKCWLLQLHLPKAKGCQGRAGLGTPTQPSSPRPDGDTHGHGNPLAGNGDRPFHERSGDLEPGCSHPGHQDVPKLGAGLSP